MKKIIKSKKLLYADITFAVSFVVFLFLGINNYFEFSHLEKYGIVQKAYVDDYSFEKQRRLKNSYSYHVKIEYHLDGNIVKHFCSFSHKPADFYYEGKQFYLLNDEEKGLKIPVEELGAAKRFNVKGYFIYSFFSVILAVFYHLVDFICDKNRNSNKWRKKQIKKNPELKAKYEKQQNLTTTILMIFILPFVLLEILFDSILKKKDKRKYK